MATKALPFLPNELWIRVLETFRSDEDLPELWMTCRHVCSTFKEAAESIFRERHLTKARIGFYLGTFVPSAEYDIAQQLPLLAEFEFSTLSDDKNIAIFNSNEGIPDDLLSLIRKRLGAYIRSVDLESPQHYVQIRLNINDGPIPALSFNADKLEISCNWHELFTAFYAEEQLYRKLTTQVAQNKEAWLAELKGKVDRREMDPMEVISKAIYAFADDDQDGRKLARRARIKKQYQDQDGTEWDFGRDGDEAMELKALKQLQQLRDECQDQDFSDDESEGSEEDSEEEEEEDDEWEDEDSHDEDA